MKLNKNFWRTTVAVAALMVAVAASADDNRSRGRVVEPGQEFSGKSYNELASEWTNWFVKEPIATNPAFDPDGRSVTGTRGGMSGFWRAPSRGLWTGPVKCRPARRCSCLWEERS